MPGNTKTGGEPALTDVVVFDTTLRDGEQAVGAAMSSDQKLEIARQLERLKVDIIEAGFPTASGSDWDAVNLISREISDCRICAFARAVPGDIEQAAAAIEPARSGLIEVVTPISDIHLDHKLGISQETALETIGSAVRFARDRCAGVHWIAEDCSRTDHEFMCRAFEAAIEAGATTVAVADTVGYATPEDFANRITVLRENVPNMDKVTISAHCHDDLGLAVANSLAGLGAGAREVQCTINGLGERAGNASLEEIVMAITCRPDMYPYRLRVETSELVPTSRLVEHATGIAVSRNKAIVGRNAFAHGSGMHQDGILKSPQTYELIDPHSVGADGRQLPITRHSGRAGIRARIIELGLQVDENEIGEVVERAKRKLADVSELSNEDLVELVDRRP